MNPGKTAVVVGAQWGDEGKGKIVDVLSERFKVVARYSGGHNAGHTVTIKGKKFILQLIPCGVLREGCRGVIGNGVVLDPFAFMKEVDALSATGVQVDGNLFISNRAHVILAIPPHDRTGGRERPGKGEDRHNLAWHRPGVFRQDGPERTARSGPARQGAAEETHRQCLPREEHDCSCAVQQRANRPRQDVHRLRRSVGSHSAVRHRHCSTAE